MPIIMVSGQPGQKNVCEIPSQWKKVILVMVKKLKNRIVVQAHLGKSETFVSKMTKAGTEGSWERWPKQCIHI
jgi:hypothetical protein